MSDAILDVWTENAKINYNKLNRSNIKPLDFIKNSNFKRGFPVILIGAGPSLNKSIEFIKSNAGSYFLICTDAALPHLVLNEVKPDICVSIDPSSAITLFYKYAYDGITICCPTTICPEVLDIPNAKYFLFSQVDPKFPDKEKVLQNIIKNNSSKFIELENKFFVGATAYQIARLLDPSKIILMGYDFSFVDGDTYCNGTMISKYDNIVNENAAWYQSYIDSGKLITWNNQQTASCAGVTTTRLFKLYCETFMKLVYNSTNVINSSLDLGGHFLDYVSYEKLGDIHEKILKPDLWKFYPRKKKR